MKMALFRGGSEMLKKIYCAILPAILLASVPFPGMMIHAEEAAAAAEPALSETEQFVADVVSSYEARRTREERYTNPELNEMTDKEYIEAHLYYTEAEESFLEKYREAEFEDLNIQYLCGKYCDAIELELDCAEKYFEDRDYAAWAKSWAKAGELRARVIVELADLYKADFSDIEDLKATAASVDDTSDSESRNKSVDRATVQKVQQLLNDIGFLCGTADGAAGKMTVSSIKRFQEVYGYEPADGIIDDELVAQLEDALAERETASAVN